MLGEPSVDCIAASARLKYWRRVVTSGPSMLRALVCNRGRPTEWQVRKDLEALTRQATEHDTDELCCAARRSTDAQWDAAARELFRHSWCVDLEMHADTITTSSVTCAECLGTGGEMRQFRSVKALLCHQHMKHGVRNPMRFFAEDGVCGACCTNFRRRLRLLDHLSIRGDRAAETRVSRDSAETLFGTSRGTRQTGQGCSHFCKAKRTLARDCTVAGFEVEWMRSWEVDFVDVCLQSAVSDFCVRLRVFGLRGFGSWDVVENLGNKRSCGANLRSGTSRDGSYLGPTKRPT